MRGGRGPLRMPLALLGLVACGQAAAQQAGPLPLVVSCRSQDGANLFKVEGSIVYLWVSHDAEWQDLCEPRQNAELGLRSRNCRLESTETRYLLTWDSILGGPDGFIDNVRWDLNRTTGRLRWSSIRHEGDVTTPSSSPERECERAPDPAAAVGPPRF